MKNPICLVLLVFALSTSSLYAQTGVGLQSRGSSRPGIRKQLPTVAPVPHVFETPIIDYGKPEKSDRRERHSEPWQDQRLISKSVRSTDSCSGLRNSYIALPFINIYSIEPLRGAPRGTHRVKGSFEGICLTEAGYYENDRQVTPVRIHTDADLKRFEFDLNVRKDTNPELRVYNINGDRHVHSLRALDRAR